MFHDTRFCARCLQFKFLINVIRANNHQNANKINGEIYNKVSYKFMI